jgi:hypothetical protein
MVSYQIVNDSPKAVPRLAAVRVAETFCKGRLRVPDSKANERAKYSASPNHEVNDR